MYELLHRNEGSDRSAGEVLGIRLAGKLTAEDYDRLAPYLKEKARTHGPLRVLVLMEDWDGWVSLTAMWKDLKLDAALNEHVERLAVVGEEDWERWMTEVTKPLAEGKVRYFEPSALEAAWAWLQDAGRSRSARP